MAFIYVNQSNNGVESGTPTQPWNTISEALAQAEFIPPSEAVTIYVLDGTYAENLDIGVRGNLSLIATNGPATTHIQPASGDAIALHGDLGASDSVSITGFSISGGSTSIRVLPDTILDSLLLDNLIIGNTAQNGVIVNDVPGLASISITNSTFTDAGSGVGNSNGSGAIVLFDFHGNATLSNVSVVSTDTALTPNADRADNGIQISGFDQATYDVTDPIGTVSFSDVSITGVFQKPLLAIQGFTNLNGLTFSNVEIGGQSDWGMLVFIDPVGSSGLDGEGSSGYPGHFAGNPPGTVNTLDLSGITITGNDNPSATIDVFVRGTDADDVYTGTNGRDYLNAPAEGDVDYGGDDTLSGLGGDDLLFGGLGNDALDGGDGYDVAIFAGARNDYQVTANGDGTFTVTDLNDADGDDGTDTIAGIEGLRFADRITYELDIHSPDLSGGFLRFDESFEDSANGNGFLSAVDGGYGFVTIVASGTDGIDAVDGSFYARLEQDPENESGPFTRFDGYRDDISGGIQTNLRIYLDPTAWADGEGFDVSMGASRTNGAHLRDFVFHVTQDTSTGDLLIGASNNTNFNPREDLETINHATVAAAGWYTFQWEMYEGENGALEVALSVYDANGNWIFSEIRNDPADLVGTVAGGNRYLWFTNIDVDGGILVDDVEMRTMDTNPVQVLNGNLIVSTHATVAEAVAAAGDGNIIDLAPGDYSAESPLSVTVENLTFRGPAGATGLSLVLAAGISNVTLDENAAIDVMGNDLSNTIIGNSANNTIDGGDEDDTLVGGAGDDVLVGGSGVDWAGYDGDRSDFTVGVQTDATGRATAFTSVTDNNASDGDEGTDSLSGVEGLSFNGELVTLDGPAQLFDGMSNFVNSYYNLESAVNASSDGASILLDDGIIPAEGMPMLEANNGMVSNGQIHVVNDVSISGLNSSIVAAVASTGTSGDSRGWFLVDDGVQFDLTDLTLDGSGYSIWQGLRLSGSSSISGVTFTNITYQTSGSPYAGTAITAFGPASVLDVSDSVFSNIGRIGAQYYGAGASGTFSNNTYYGKGDVDGIDYAVEVGAGAEVTIAGNTIQDNRGVASSDGSQSAGILVSTYYGAGSMATISGNTFTDNSVGIYVGYNMNDTSVVHLTGTNTINSTYAGAAGLIVMGNAVVTGVNASLAGNAATVEWYGGNLDNMIEGALLSDHLEGNDGNDTILGNAGDDYLDGGSGNDILNGGEGADFMIGGAGDDTFYVDDLGDAVFELNGGGTDTVMADITYTLFANVENLVLTGSANIDGTGNTSNNSITGNAGNNMLNGRAGDDILNGGLGADHLDGGLGIDTADFTGSAGGVQVNLFYGVGLYNDAAGDTYAGIENVWGSEFNDIMRGSTGANTLEGRGGNDFLMGDAGNDILIGGAGNDILRGGVGADQLQGGSGFDVADYSDSNARVLVNLFYGNALQGHAQGDTFVSIESAFGSAFNDIIRGSTGNNALRGNAGDDILIGDGGADLFQYADTNWGNDLITDFTDGVDKLDLRGSGLAFGDLTIQVSGGDTYVSITGVAGSAIKLDNFTATLDASDFVF